VGWTETPSLTFTARHESSQADEALAVLESLEAYRTELEGLFPRMPANVTVVLHDSPVQLALAQPHLSLARRFASAAGRRYMAGWFTRDELHVLAPHVLRRAAGGTDSLKALMLTPERTFTLLVVGTNNELLPPPFRVSSMQGFMRMAWLAEGAAQFFSGQLPHLRAAIARRLRGSPPRLPPSLRDAALIGGSVYDLLGRERGIDACVQLALTSGPLSGAQMIEDAFGAELADVRLRWRSHLAELARADPAVTLDPFEWTSP
jgi:hypothetical protein